MVLVYAYSEFTLASVLVAALGAATDSRPILGCSRLVGDCRPVVGRGRSRPPSNSSSSATSCSLTTRKRVAGIAPSEDPFEPFAKLLKGADVAVGNLECVIAEKGEPVPKPFQFLADPHWIPVLKKHFTALW